MTDKITVFEVPGTSVENSMTGVTHYIPPEEIYKNKLYQGLDPDIFDYVFIQGHANVIKPMGPSVAKGVEILTNYINTTSGKFAVVGTSQGALIATQVAKKIASGEIDRSADNVGFFMFGNPGRKAGTAFPGAASVAPGQGIANSSYRFSTTPSWVWEFANPGDPVCTNDPNTIIGSARSAVFDNLLTSWDGTLDSLSDIADIANDIIGMMSFGVTSALDMALFHCGYDAPDYKPGLNDTRSAFQIVIDYLNKVAGPRYRSDGWSTTLKYPTS